MNYKLFLMIMLTATMNCYCAVSMVQIKQKEQELKNLHNQLQLNKTQNSVVAALELQKQGILKTIDALNAAIAQDRAKNEGLFKNIKVSPNAPIAISPQLKAYQKKFLINRKQLLDSHRQLLDLEQKMLKVNPALKTLNQQIKKKSDELLKLKIQALPSEKIEKPQMHAQ